MPKPRSLEEKELIQNVMEEFEKEKNHFKRQISIQALPKDAAPLNYSNVAKRTALTLKVCHLYNSLKWVVEKLKSNDLTQNQES